MANPFDHIHIKGRTAGSSNELSFDVLDAAREGVVPKSERRSHGWGLPGRGRGREKGAQRADSRSISIPTGPRPSQGSYSGVGSTSTLSSTLSAVPEVERRKRERRAHEVRLRVIVAIVVFAGAIAAGYSGYALYQGQVDFTGSFRGLIGQLAEIDPVIVEVDGLMADPLNSVEVDEREAILEKFEPATEALEKVIADARALADDPNGPADDTALSQIETSARARESMLVAATDTFKLSEIVNNQVNVANDAWNGVLAGDAAARQATELANSARTEQATLEARELTEQAAALMAEGRKELALLAREMKQLDFAPELAYIDKRLEALDEAVQTSDALIDGNRSSALTHNTAYNDLDQEAAELASALSVSLGDQIRGQYADEVKRLRDGYLSARTQATTTDAALRAA